MSEKDQNINSKAKQIAELEMEVNSKVDTIGQRDLSIGLLETKIHNIEEQLSQSMESGDQANKHLHEMLRR
jgi:septal ring factor EnvC (AmiA/AmiB activator)